MIEPGMRAGSPPDDAPAGWYPDMADSGLMRYWDGYHLTGQTIPVEPLDGVPGVRSPGGQGVGVDSSPGAIDRPGVARLAVAPAAAVPANVPARKLPGMVNDTWTALRGVGEMDAEADHREPDPLPMVAPKVGASAAVKANVFAVVPAGSSDAKAPTDPVEPDLPGAWARKTERAVAQAVEAGTPDAWQEAAATAAVVEHLAQTMVVAATATRTTEEARVSAEHAEREAKAAARKATEAEENAKQATRAAERAEAASKAAADASARARDTAEQAAEAAPRIAETARAAAHVAQAALRKSSGIDEIVAKALATDTPAAWSEAHELAARAMA